MNGAAETPAGLLPRPPEEGARLLALSYLDQAQTAHHRLGDSSDTEALHDFRVALRRLRSCLRAYRRTLAGSIPKKVAKRLRRLADSTGPGRDVEVQIEWLRGRASHLASAHRPGLTWLVARLEKRMREAYADLAERIPREFPPLEEDLRRNLSVYRPKIHLELHPEARTDRPTFAGATAALLREQISDLEDRLDRVDDADDEKEAHAARIAAKRLRYLIEPLAADLHKVAPLVKRFKGLQDLLGELHDAHVLETVLAEAVEEAAAERAGKLFEITLTTRPDDALLRAERRRARESGILALARLNRARRDHLFAELDLDWLSGQADDFLRQLEALEEKLETLHPSLSPHPPAPSPAPPSPSPGEGEKT